MDRALHGRWGTSPRPVLKQANTSLYDRQAALESWKQLLLSGALLGAGARGALGLVNLIRHNLSSDDNKKEEAAVPLPAPLQKKSADVQPDPFNYWPHWVGAPLSFGVGLAGSYTLADWLLNRVRKARLREDTDKARQEFLEVITAGGEQEGTKTAASRNALDDLFELYQQKGASFTNKALGLYALYALATGLLTGTLAYNSARKHDRARMLQEASRQLADRRRFETPPRVTFEMPASPADEEETATS